MPTIDDGRIRLTRVEFDRWGGDAPFEDSPVLEEERFSTFADRVRSVLGHSVAGPLIDDYWPRVLKRRGEAATHGMRFSLARRELEASWGVANLEVPMSEVCQTDGFYWFVSHLLAQLPRYRQVHNDALDEYRAAHGIRSKNHPVAALAQTGRVAGGAVLDLARRTAAAPGPPGPPALAGDGPAHRRRRRGLARAAAGARARGVLRRRAAPGARRPLGPLAHARA